MTFCRVCDKDFEPRMPTQAVCSVQCARRIPVINRKEQKALEKARRLAIKPRSKWLSEAQAAFNAWIRHRDADRGCISCGTRGGKMNAGHYLSTVARPDLRFDDRNVHRQCERCNTYLSGNLLAYRPALIERIGQEQVALLEVPREHHKWSVADLRAIKDDYPVALVRMQAVMCALAMKREYVDFISVPKQQLEIHGRLENWGRWCHGTGHAQVSPMFCMYRSSEVYTGFRELHVPVDSSDAANVGKGVVALPESHRHAMSWYYVNKGSPRRACRVIACTMHALNQYVLDARAMLINRGV